MLLESKYYGFIYEYPVEKSRETYANEHPYDPTIDNLTIGDLHSNVIKFIHILIQHGIVDIRTPMTDAQSLPTQEKIKIYDDLVRAYFSNNCTAIVSFMEHNLQFNPKKPFIRLIGDTLADRGMNDFFMLLFYSVLSDYKVPFEVILSNHDAGFLNGLFLNRHYLSLLEKNKTLPIEERATILPPWRWDPDQIDIRPCNSFQTMQALIKNRPKMEGIIELLINQGYLPNLKFIGYEWDNESNTLTLITHAPFGLKSLSELTKELNIAYDHDHATPGSIIMTIDKINSKMKRMIDNGGIFNLRNGCQTNSALWRLVWRRIQNQYDIEDLMPTHNGLNFNYRHGHDQPKYEHQDLPSHIQSYDNLRGKNIDPNPNTGNIAKERSLLADPGIHTNNFIDHAHSKGLTPEFRIKLKKDIAKLSKLKPATMNEKQRLQHDQFKKDIESRIAMLPSSLQDFPKAQLKHFKKLIPLYKPLSRPKP